MNEDDPAPCRRVRPDRRTGLNSVHSSAPKSPAPLELAIHSDMTIEEAAPAEEYTGMGGPIEERAHYPPCKRKGPGEDSCIQLYERGVTGRDN